MLLSLLLLAAGIVVLVIGADLMVRGASSLAIRLGLSTLFVGLTVVAFATSAPELVVAVRSSLAGFPDLAIGNVVGSNIANVCVILGLSALLVPIPCTRVAIRRDAPLMALVTVGFWFVCRGGVSRVESAILVLILAGYIAVSYRAARVAGEPPSSPAIPDGAATAAPKGGRASLVRDLALVGFGLGGLLLGADWLVKGAVDIAERLGMSEAVIGLTIVAVGTSLPEVATSFVAALKKEPDLAIGNVVGSNLWNLLGVAGMAGMVQGLPVDGRFLRFDLPACAGAAALCAVFMWTGSRVGRREGVVFLLGYAAYVFACLRVT